MVSYRGKKWLLLEVTGSPNQPMTAKIQQATHADAVAMKTVKYDTLRPLASMREKLLYAADVKATVGNFVFFSQEKKIDGEQRSLVLSGEITKVDNTEHTVHVYDPRPQHTCYLPSWECKGKPDLNKKTQPKGYHKEVATFDSADLELVTHLTKGLQIPRQAWMAMKAKGIVPPMEYTAKADAAADGSSHQRQASVAAVAASKTKRRPSRRDRLTMSTGDLQHAWVNIMLQQCGLPVKHDALLDHGRLMHHLIHGRTTAPSGAMMDADYASMLATVGGPDEDNMVSQMQSVVCCEVNPASHSVYPSAPMYDGNPEHFAAENQLYASMLQWDEFQVPEENAGTQQEQHSIDDHCAVQHTEMDKHEPTAPPWEDGAQVVHTAGAAEPVQQAQPIQCIVTPRTHTTPTAVTVLAFVGSVSMMAVIGLIMMLCWLAFQGVHVTGFWLTLKLI